MAPRWINSVLMLLVALACVPVACIARARTIRSPVTRLHLVQDMDNQGRFRAQAANPIFADGRAMRAPVAGTVAQISNDRFTALEDPRYRTGVDGNEFTTLIPVALDSLTLERGQQRYEIFCSPCHGLSGYGDGVVARRADRLQQGSWVPPASLHAEPAFSRAVGHLFNTVTNGIRTMPAYGSQIPIEDRWAIVAYIRALQRSQHASVSDVPVGELSKLR